MSGNSQPSSGNMRISGSLWVILVLLVVAVAINYIDRGSLSTAAPLLKAEMDISPVQLGILLSAFFWTYSLLQIFSGWLADRYDVKWVMAIGFFIWSVSTAASGFVYAFAPLLLLRLMLGVGESVAFPCCSKIIAGSFAEHQRGRANSLIDAAGKFGPALGILLGGLLMERYGWRPVFVVLGIGSLIWLPAWFKWLPSESNEGQRVLKESPGFMDILKRQKAWATFLGHFCGNYLWYFLLTWLPFYLVKERGFSMEKMAVVGAIAYCVTATSTIITGWLADRAIAAGSTPTRVRKICVVTGLTFSTIVVMVVVVNGAVASMAFLMFACLAYGVFASSHWSISQTISGPAAAGKWTGLQNFISNMAGVAAPAITGLVVDITGHFFWAFVVSAVVVLVGASIYAFLLGQVEILDWSDKKNRQS